jgi:hypothetical protein
MPTGDSKHWQCVHLFGQRYVADCKVSVIAAQLTVLSLKIKVPITYCDDRTPHCAVGLTHFSHQHQMASTKTDVYRTHDELCCSVLPITLMCRYNTPLVHMKHVLLYSVHGYVSSYYCQSESSLARDR